MNQLEFKFFWPLTEQIPLDLDYTQCDTKSLTSFKYSDIILASPTVNIAFAPATYPTTLDLDSNFYFKYVDEPPWYRKILLKLIGFKWRTK